ncbi:MAG: SDR family oxidoreductase [Caulobacteraceae bacterium]
MSEPSFKGKTVVITGGASGIGRATALAFARAGANVVAADVNDAGLAEVESEISALGAQGLAVHCDVSSDDDVDALAARAVQRFGQVDILMNNAGVMLRGHIEKIAIAEWEWIFGINFLGPVRGLRSFLPAMIARGDGYIINTASIGGLMGGRPHSAGYSASKFALVGLSETLYMYLKPKGIGVSVLCPGGVSTNRGLDLRRVSVNETDTSDLGLDETYSPAAAEPALVADLVLQAVADRQFLILTDPRHQKMLERRTSNIQAFADQRIRERG